MTRDELLALIDQAEREEWTELDLSNKGLIELPSEIGCLTKLEQLYLSKRNDTLTSGKPNQLKELPLELFYLSNLSEIWLARNCLIEIPSEIKLLTQLEFLNLHSNQITKLPTEISRLSKLKVLILNGNYLKELPDDFFLLQNLEHLALGNNPLADPGSELKRICDLPKLKHLYFWGQTPFEVPPEINKLELETLNLGRNNLTKLPIELTQIRNLENLYLSNNLLCELPIQFEQLANLKSLSLENNPYLRFPPSDVISFGISAIINYLRSVKIGSYHVWKSKCLIIGEGGVGKTTLFESLNGRPFDENEQGTVGIEIGPLDLPHPEKEDVTMRLNCWDFAGQDFNHAMHQFFFSNRALFLLVWNARHGWQQGKLYRWLENIKVRTPEAKVILVATHTDQPHSDYPAADLQAKYPQIVDTIEVSSKTGDKIPDSNSQFGKLVDKEAKPGHYYGAW